MVCKLEKELRLPEGREGALPDALPDSLFGLSKRKCARRTNNNSGETGVGEEGERRYTRARVAN